MAPAGTTVRPNQNLARPKFGRDPASDCGPVFPTVLLDPSTTGEAGWEGEAEGPADTDPNRHERVVARRALHLVPPLDRHIAEPVALDGRRLIVFQRGVAVAIEAHPILDRPLHFENGELPADAAAATPPSSAVRRRGHCTTSNPWGCFACRPKWSCTCKRHNVLSKEALKVLGGRDSRKATSATSSSSRFTQGAPRRWRPGTSQSAGWASPAPLVRGEEGARRAGTARKAGRRRERGGRGARGRRGRGGEEEARTARKVSKTVKMFHSR